MAKERSEVAIEDKWNVEALFSTLEEWEKEFSALKEESDKKWPELTKFIGKLGESAAALKNALDKQLDYSRSLSKLITYAQLRHDEDLANEKYKNAYDRITSLYYDFMHQSAWVEPEILAISEEKINKFLQDSILQKYKFFLEKIIQLKPHFLDREKEQLLSLAAKPLETANQAFSLLNNADIKFPNVVNEKGESLELTHGQYGAYMQSQDRVLRKDTFFKLHETYASFENTICELLNGEIQTRIFHAKARKYPSTLEAALFPHQIDTKVYLSLIETVRKNLEQHHNYVRLRKKALGYEEIHFYDMYNPIVPSIEMKFSFQEAVDLVLESLTPLGKEYQEFAEKGIKQQRWIDRFENKRKRSGAYSGGCYDSMPYILLNYKGYLRDVMTLTHELGHSMHSFYSRKKQPFHYSHYSIFVAEVASTFHEELLFRHLLNKVKSEEEKAFLINQKIDDIRATFFRQSMFAEFEKILHELGEKNVPLIPGTLKEQYKQLNMAYFGKEFSFDEILSVEFMRIPHFYYNFYVYQYATGISASFALVQKVLAEGEESRQKYIDFLSSGGSDYPLEILRRAGVDMTKPQTFELLLKNFGDLTNQLESMLV
ncbi:MAG: oligoendopeptidase F [Simkaniaceae bacterium]